VAPLEFAVRNPKFHEHHWSTWFILQVKQATLQFNLIYAICQQLSQHR
jgi:hypothetical protein